MDKLPTEVLTFVSQFLPQKYIAVLSIICKQWQSDLCQPLFFNMINTYSIQQLKKCIGMANKKTIKNKLISYYVERFYFYTGSTSGRNDIYKHDKNFSKYSFNKWVFNRTSILWNKA